MGTSQPLSLSVHAAIVTPFLYPFSTRFLLKYIKEGATETEILVTEHKKGPFPRLHPSRTLGGLVRVCVCACVRVCVCVFTLYCSAVFREKCRVHQGAAQVSQTENSQITTTSTSVT